MSSNVLTITWLLLASAVSLQPSATRVLGRVERDVTGDGKPEILQVIATGPIENLDPIFTIQSAGKTIYSYRLAPLTLTVGFDGGSARSLWKSTGRGSMSSARGSSVRESFSARPSSSMTFRDSMCRKFPRSLRAISPLWRREMEAKSGTRS
jgi:hypothetical protein